ncbi:hypothetical protein PInf_005503 [Phytophthora infestans]|nr:hypothetical protein PInf_005503 [Phytophthora infestans]
MESSSPSDVDVLDDLLRDVDGEDDLALQEPAPMGYFSPLSSDVVVQAVLDLASSADNEDASERSRETNENEAAIPTEEEQLKSSQKLIQNEEKVVNDAEEHELPLGGPEDDDEDVLEVDATVIGSLHIEEKERGSKEESSSDADKNALLKAPPSSKDDGPSAIDLSFSGEVCVAHVATLEPGSPFSDIHRIAGGSNAGKLLSDATFGISYQSLRKKMDEPGADEDEGKYTLPSGPAFPDEREFEKEMELTSDVSFSVATTGASPSKTIGTAEDDEFAFDVNLENDLSVLSEVSIKARRESLEVKKRKEEEELLKELKRATDEEKKLNESDQAMDSTQPDATAYKDADALSLAELHSIYKRGLGDQEVLMDEEKKNSTEAESSRSSVMGRIFSPISGKTETIIEEADDEDSEGEEKAHNDGREASVACDNAPDTKATSEKRDVDESAEWREIKLVQHRQSQSANAGDSPETAIVSYTEAAKYYAETPDVMQHRDIIVSEDFSRGSCMKCLSRPRLTFPGAIDERDRVFCIAATAFDAHNEIVMYVALASQLHDAIQSRSDEIPVVLKDILDRGRSNPIKVIGEAFDGDSLRPSRPAEVIVPSKLKASDRKVLDNNLEFTEIGLQAVDEKE